MKGKERVSEKFTEEEKKRIELTEKVGNVEDGTAIAKGMVFGSFQRRRAVVRK